MAKKSVSVTEDVAVEVAVPEIRTASFVYDPSAPFLLQALESGGIKCAHDAEAKNFAVKSNEGLLHGKDAQLIFDYNGDGVVTGVRVL